MNTATVPAFHIYSVFRDGTESCICVAVERKYTYYIPMEASQVRVRKDTHDDFRQELAGKDQAGRPVFRTRYAPYDYPVRRAAEIYLRAPDKTITDEAREHLSAILADPAYEYDRSLFPTLKEETTMAKKSAAAVAEEVAAKPRNKKEALAAAGEIASKPVGAQKAPKAAKEYGADGKATEPAAKKAAAPKAEKTGGGRAPALDTAQRFKCGEGASKVRAGFMLEFLNKAQEMEKASRGKGFTGDALLEAAADLPGAAGRDAAWVKTYLSYGAAPARAIFVAA